jgi:purine-binding chemotaxis protein CheW
MFENLEESTEEMKVIVFQLKDEEYGVPVYQVKTIERIGPMTRVPRTHDFVKGVINLRGVVTPIIDLRGRFQMEETEYTDNTRIIVVAVEDIEVGLVVDSANDVLDIPRNSIEPPPEVIGGIRAAYLNGIAKLDDRLLVLLNLEKVLNKEEIQQLEHLEEIL